MKKFLKYAVLTALLLVVIGVVVVILSLNNLIKAAVEKGGTAATQTETKLDSVNLGLLSGQLKLSGFDMKNPQGFTAGSSFIKFASSEVQIEPRSLMSDEIQIGILALDGLELSYEQPAQGKANYEVIMESVKRLLPVSSGGTAPASTDSTAKSSKKMHIGSIKFTNAKIHVSAASVAGVPLPIKAPITLEVPLIDFKMDNISAKDTSDLSAQVIKELTKQLIDQAPAIGEKVAQSAKANLKNIDVDGIKKQVDETTDAVNGLKNLLK